jgi:hypothetical protein
MRHQAQLVAAAAAGHRTFLLADEPGLGKTAQALLAAQAPTPSRCSPSVPTSSRPTGPARPGIWTPNRTVTVIHGDGDDIDGFADIVVVNYEVLDRHVGWLGDLGFRGWWSTRRTSSRTSPRSAPQHVLAARRARSGPHGRPLLMALTGTPADQRHRGLPRDLAVPRLDRRQEAARRADGAARGDRADPGRPGFYPPPARA